MSGTALMGGLTVAPSFAATATQAAPVTAKAASAEQGASASAANDAPNWTPSNAPASALVGCGSTPTTNGYGGATVTTSIYLRTGPGVGCDDIYPKLLVGQRLGGWCWATNTAGNKWYYVSTGGAAPYGWIYGTNISGESTIETRCNV
ncbi:hypothetical protein [Streptomyces sp. NBC_01190]|uniref:hypothetical protein n=1 Tax=Streptomyces sp. NBC_01190 TaxID=2903767 RepID=UPI0038641B23|nr:hypothetical protein OG519_00160 [Streptomyces sp. NBC_01190]